MCLLGLLWDYCCCCCCGQGSGAIWFYVCYCDYSLYGGDDGGGGVCGVSGSFGGSDYDYDWNYNDIPATLSLLLLL